jgi:hypothetical protein
VKKEKTFIREIYTEGHIRVSIFLKDKISPSVNYTGKSSTDCVE